MDSGTSTFNISAPVGSAGEAGIARSRPELKQCLLSGVLFRAYRVPKLGGRCVSLALRLEGGSCFSATLRRILIAYHGVEVGAYSYGECIIPGAFPPGVTVGRYVSVASGVRVFLRNHPYERLSMHPFFYNPALGYVPEDTVPSGALRIDHDVWIGERAILTPGCRRVGLGAVLGAGAVVTQDVPPFAIVAGNPARFIRRRFSDDICDAIIASRWWEHPVAECARHMPQMIQPLVTQEDVRRHPLLRHSAPAGNPPVEGTRSGARED